MNNSSCTLIVQLVVTSVESSEQLLIDLNTSLLISEEQLLINKNEDCLPFVYIYIIAELRGDVKLSLHAVIMIHSQSIVSWFVSMRLMGIAPMLVILTLS